MIKRKKKVVKKVTKKAVKRIARRKVTKVKPKKVVAKKPIKKVKKVTTPSNKVRVGNFSFEPTIHDKFPEMVVITNAPSWAKKMIGKKYVDSGFATRTITALVAERMVDGGAKVADNEIKSVVGVTIEPISITPVNVDYYTEE